MQQVSWAVLAILVISLAVLVSSLSARTALRELTSRSQQAEEFSFENREAIKSRSEEVYLVMGAGEAYAKGNYQFALERYIAARELASANHFIAKKIGDCYRKQGECNLATQAYRQALNLHPESMGIQTALTIALSRADRYSEALEVIEQVEDPGSLALYTHARVYMYWWKNKGKPLPDGHFDLAIDFYRECQNKSQGSWAPWCHYDEAALVALKAADPATSEPQRARSEERAVTLAGLALRKAHEIEASEVPRMRSYFLSDEDFRLIRGKPRFRALLAAEVTQ